jgi:hypothetical protein
MSSNVRRLAMDVTEGLKRLERGTGHMYGFGNKVNI